MRVNLLPGHDMFLLEGHARSAMKQAKGVYYFEGERNLFLLYSTRRLAELSQLRISDVLLASVAFVNILRPWLLSLLKQKCLERKTYRS